MRSDKTACNDHARLCLAATLYWLSPGAAAHSAIYSTRFVAETGSGTGRVGLSTP